MYFKNVFIHIVLLNDFGNNILIRHIAVCIMYMSIYIIIVKPVVSEPNWHRIVTGGDQINITWQLVWRNKMGETKR